MLNTLKKKNPAVPTRTMHPARPTAVTLRVTAEVLLRHVTLSHFRHLQKVLCEKPVLPGLRHAFSNLSLYHVLCFFPHPHNSLACGKLLGGPWEQQFRL